MASLRCMKAYGSTMQTHPQRPSGAMRHKHTQMQKHIFTQSSAFLCLSLRRKGVCVYTYIAVQIVKPLEANCDL